MTRRAEAPKRASASFLFDQSRKLTTNSGEEPPVPRKPLLLTGLTAAMALFCAVAQAGNANAEPMDLEPEMLSKLALERAKTGSTRAAAARDNKRATSADAGANPVADCGALAIGNVNTGGRIGFQPREVTVIITGDVINSNNRCR
jgi:hypothetical protein